jgi:hypothetical protein
MQMLTSYVKELGNSDEKVRGPTGQPNDISNTRIARYVSVIFVAPQEVCGQSYYCTRIVLGKSAYKAEIGEFCAEPAPNPLTYIPDALHCTWPWDRMVVLTFLNTGISHTHAIYLIILTFLTYELPLKVTVCSLVSGLVIGEGNILHSANAT